MNGIASYPRQYIGPIQNDRYFAEDIFEFIFLWKFNFADNITGICFQGSSESEVW